jgi:hypothetical protein
MEFGDGQQNRIGISEPGDCKPLHGSCPKLAKVALLMKRTNVSNAPNVKAGARLNGLRIGGCELAAGVVPRQ